MDLDKEGNIRISSHSLYNDSSTNKNIQEFNPIPQHTSEPQESKLIAVLREQNSNIEGSQDQGISPALENSPKTDNSQLDPNTETPMNILNLEDKVNKLEYNQYLLDMAEEIFVESKNDYYRIIKENINSLTYDDLDNAKVKCWASELDLIDRMRKKLL
jgi:hypothetical protein